MKILYDSIYSNTDRVYNNDSLSKYILHETKQKKKGFFDSLIGIDSERLSFYHENKENPRVLLDAINFFDGICGFDTARNFYFGDDGHGQIIPASAVPRIKTEVLPKLGAEGNKLCLSSKSYVSYTSKDGTTYACAFTGKSLSIAFTEDMLRSDRGNGATKDYKEMFTTTSVISGLIRESINGLYMFSGETVKDALANVGIKPGKFSISVDGEEKTYYLSEDGTVRTEKATLALVDRYNRFTYLHNHSVGDEVTVFGRKYKIGEDGHIHVPTENFWASGEFDI